MDLVTFAQWRKSATIMWMAILPAKMKRRESPLLFRSQTFALGCFINRAVVPGVWHFAQALLKRIESIAWLTRDERMVNLARRTNYARF
jgi:hypothetical protein